MRSPDRRAAARRPPGEDDLQLKYLSPGAFTILSPEEYGVNPDPPSAPPQYRLTPTSNRRRTKAFSIIAEASSNPGSRSPSPSPSGRVSPFRGRGFNPTGSRHASPNPSPPPPATDDSRQSSASRSSLDSVRSPRRSQIPQLRSRGSAGNLFGEKVTQDHHLHPKLGSQLSQSLTNVSAKQGFARTRRKAAFERLSPIAGSSPETGSLANKSMSSPSRIPLSRSRKASPRRRDGSGGGINVREVPPKVNSFSKAKPKVPPKPHAVNKTSGGHKLVKRTSQSALKSNHNHEQKGSASRVVVGSDDGGNQSGGGGYQSNGGGYQSNDGSNQSTGGSNQSNDGSNQSTVGGNQSTSGRNQSSGGSNQSGNRKSEISKLKSNSNQGNSNINSTKSKISANSNKKDAPSAKQEPTQDPHQEVSETKPELKTRESSSTLVDIPTATVVSSTTATAVQPLNIEEDLDNMLKEELNKVSGYANDNRTLSATSVSSAMNKMNDTVLNSQTILRERNFTKLSPAATAIISLSNDSNNKALDTKSATTALPTIESIHKKIDGVGQNINSAFADADKVHMESIGGSVKNNVSKAITPDHAKSYAQKGGNDRILDGRTTLVTPDVKPIKILVKEKPSDVEVQSGNIRLPSSATNGLSSSPSLPPSQSEVNEADREQEERPTTKKNCCLRILSRCRCKRPTCGKLKRKSEEASTAPEVKKAKTSLNCFGCKRKGGEETDQHKEREKNSERKNSDEKQPGSWERLKCCKPKKVGDAGKIGGRKAKKENWAEKQQSTVEENAKSKTSCKDKCKNAFRAVFCCGLCCRKKKIEEDPATRRESMISKKKSLTPQTLPPPDTRPKIDISLVEHTSLMRGAIPVLPVSIAWICLFFNIFLPGMGTVLSGMFCLCLGKPRFSQNDGPRPRIGAFIIDLIIGCGQLFTVLFCLVGWGWSIWWGVIMLKVARKFKRIRLVEERAQAQAPAVNHHSRDPERGS